MPHWHRLGSRCPLSGRTRPRTLRFALVSDVVGAGAGLAHGPAASVSAARSRAVPPASPCCPGPCPTVMGPGPGVDLQRLPRPSIGVTAGLTGSTLLSSASPFLAWLGPCFLRCPGDDALPCLLLAGRAADDPRRSLRGAGAEGGSRPSRPAAHDLPLLRPTSAVLVPAWPGLGRPSMN